MSGTLGRGGSSAERVPPVPTRQFNPHGVERRRVPRDRVQGEPSRSHLCAEILGAYHEMPGLTLTLPQAARLFALRETTCRVVLDDLVMAGRLRHARDGQYVRA